MIKIEQFSLFLLINLGYIEVVELQCIAKIQLRNSNLILGCQYALLYP